jgi:hypothetical protein
MPSASEIVAKLVLQGQQQFVTGMDKATKATAGAGKASETSGKKAGISASGFFKWAASATAVYKAYGFFKGAVSQTEDLARATAALQRTTGMDAKTASEWAVTAKERGVSSMVLNRGFLSLGKQISSASKATSQSAKTFRELGLSQKQLVSLPTEKRVELVADALRGIKDPLERAATGQKLFGRSYLNLASIMSKGGAGIRAHNEELAKSGAVLNQKQVDDNKKLLAAQRALDKTMMAIKITIATALMPVIKSLADEVNSLLQRYRPWLALMAKHAGIILGVAAAITTLVLATRAYKVAVTAVKMATDAWRAAQWLLNVALDANPVGAIIIAVIALVASLVLAYKRVKWFRDFVNAAFRAVLHVVQAVAHAIGKVAHLASSVGGFIGDVAGVVPGLAEGGTIVKGGQVLVGEHGPELLSLPTGASITPLAAPAAVTNALGGQQTLITKVYLDKRQIAMAVADVTADRKARR